MPHQLVDHTKDGGWNGNPDIYGIGKTIFVDSLRQHFTCFCEQVSELEFYTQAASIWVANFFAPHEAPYIHTVALLFLVAVLVGVCPLARYEVTHIVEPYILMPVAYNVGLRFTLSIYGVEMVSFPLMNHLIKTKRMLLFSWAHWQSQTRAEDRPISRRNWPTLFT